MKKRYFIFLISFAFFLGFSSNAYALMTATDNMDGSVAINSDGGTPFVVCYDAEHTIPDDNLHSSAQASASVPFNMTYATGFQSPGNLIVAGVPGVYTCFGFYGSHMPEWPVFTPVYQEASVDEWVEFTWDGSNIVSVPTEGISESALLPADSSTDVPAIIVFTGTYTNTGTYNNLKVSLTPSGGTEQTYLCGTATTGTDVAFSCTITGQVSTTYDYTASLCTDDTSCITTAPRTFTTADTFSVPPTFGGNDCSTFDVGCYIASAFQWLFTPSQNVLDNFAGLYTLFEHKPPFGYVIAIKNALTDINITETSAFTLETMPILNDYIFDPFRLALAWVLWVGFAYVLFSRVKDLQL
jgi:hypothetical protein